MTMRQRANYSLIALACLFIISLILHWRLDQPWWTKAMLFISEAGMVGALADWFAVSALFRHPLGMRWIPHTAIVPRNRDKLVDGVVLLVEQQLLNKKMIEDQLAKLNFTELLISWLDKRWNVKLAEQTIRRLLALVLRNVQTESAVPVLEKQLKDAVSRTKLAPHVSKGLAYAMEKGYDHQLLDLLINTAQKRVLQSDVKPAIKRLLESEKDKMLGKDGGSWLTRALFSFAQAADAVNFDDAVDVIYRDLLLLLAQLKDHDHELRILLRSQLKQLVVLLEREDIEDALEVWKQQLLRELSIAPFLQQLVNGLVEQLAPAASAAQDIEATTMQKWLARLLHQYYNWMKTDELSKELIEQKLKSFMLHMIEKEHKVIGQIVRSTLDTFSEERLVQFIESKVEVDLQRIRVNGAFIGAVIGALLYGLLYGVYEPVLELLGRS